MFKFDYYYHKDEEDEKLSLDWFVFEDHWFQRYLFDKPRHQPEDMERLRQKNLNRHKWFTIRLNIFSFKVNLDIRLKKIGNLYYGRMLEDSPKPSPRKRRKQQ